ncbi:MAG: hypothetical protein R2865_01890 [Deinococcales bacterium]
MIIYFEWLLDRTIIDIMFPGRLPVYVVEGVGVSAADATKLAEALDIQADIREASGKLFYVDARAFRLCP